MTTRPSLFPAAARIEILELTPPGQTLDEGSPVIPNEVRINGIPLLTSGEPGDEVIVNEIRTSGGGLSLASVTLTLLASSITVEARDPATDATAHEATRQARATEVDVARWTAELDALGANTSDMRDALLALAASTPDPETVRVYAESSARIAERVAAPTTWRDVWEDLGMAWRDLVRVVLRR